MTPISASNDPRGHALDSSIESRLYTVYIVASKKKKRRLASLLEDDPVVAFVGVVHPLERRLKVPPLDRDLL